MDRQEETDRLRLTINVKDVDHLMDLKAIVWSLSLVLDDRHYQFTGATAYFI